MKIDDSYLINVLNKIISYDGTPILVGGCVRDYFLNLPVKDYDIEVYGINSLEELEHILEEFGDVNLVGKSFGILKLFSKVTNQEYDFSFPRTESKVALGHRGFEVIVQGDLEYKEASKRRDFTINSIGYDFKNRVFLDPYDGRADLEKKVLRYIDEITFIEDPLRVYRAIQFSARFNFQIDKKTYNLCKQITLTNEFKNLSKERIYEEYKKLFLKSKKPSIGLLVLNDLEIETFDTLTISRIDEIVLEDIDDEKKLILIFLLLENLFIKICDDKKLLKKIITLKTFKIPKIYEHTLKENCTFTQELVLKLQLLENMPKPLFMGKDLLNMGYKPSPKFKTILDTLYKMQLDGKIC